jgi:ribosomal protein S18 acetylase RimI-like enzyme
VATDNDLDWISDLMDQALGVYYGGDHRAHARRILTTHLQGGKDAVGHFSVGQYMYLVEVDGQRAGMIHLVDKKQQTMKISPLIVSSQFRGVRGLGSLLLRHAETIARQHEARQIYCTVAAPNKQALDFFVRKGFRITGMAKDHYKQGIDEHMLYKQLIADTDLSAPNLSVIPFDDVLHAMSARSIILNHLAHNFMGVDDAWVDALFAGYHRRTCGDVNEKFKIIFVCEEGGRVVGVAGATPKKGDPIKLMPLVAESEAAFEALIIDLQGLLVDYGHKLYVHLVPVP